jgi:hypothetical protein
MKTVTMTFSAGITAYILNAANCITKFLSRKRKMVFEFFVQIHCITCIFWHPSNLLAIEIKNIDAP